MPEKKFHQAMLLILTLVSIIIIFAFIPRIPQWSGYHQFADARKIWGITNFANVISNSLFILVSVLGFISLRNQWRNKNLTRQEVIVFLMMLIGIFLTGVGSAYYHWLPNNDSLVWDRLPMTLVFMSLLALTIMERVNLKIGFLLLFPLIFFGIFSVLYWHWTESFNQGDLRFYLLTQFYSIFLILMILVFFPKPYPPLKIYIWMFIFYGLAKLFEYLDLTIYNMGGLISGHTLKHIFAALSAYGAVIMLRERRKKLGNYEKYF